MRSKRIYGLCLSLHFECNIFLDIFSPLGLLVCSYNKMFFYILFILICWISVVHTYTYYFFAYEPNQCSRHDIVHFRHYIKWQNRTMWLLKFILLDKKKCLYIHYTEKIFHFNIMSFCTDILDIHGSIILLMWYGLCYGGISFSLYNAVIWCNGDG